MSTYGTYGDNNSTHTPRWQDQITTQRDLGVQMVVSVVFGLSAFISFCVLRPKWSELYSARKKHSDAAMRLPELPKTMFGWIPVLWRISDEEVLASAGLDAYAFLSFFSYAIKYLSVTLFFSLTIILPVNFKFKGDIPGLPLWPGWNDTRNNTETFMAATLIENLLKKPKNLKEKDDSYLWMYVAFAYFYTAVAFYLLVIQTKKIIRIRQAYLGTQATVTDRTIRLSGIPVDMRSEDQITAFIEDLGIGKVDSVMLCKDWSRLDLLMEERMRCLRRLEESWATHLGHHHSLRHTRQSRNPRESGDDHESAALLSSAEMELAHTSSISQERPKHTIRYGFLNLRYNRVDAIHYYEEKLRKLDELIESVRQADFTPTPLAFVTMESTAACQMAVQAILDPIPGQFIASLAPPPADVVWKNTYLSRNHRMARSWSIMIFIGFLTVFWAILLIPLAGLLSIEAIDKVLPGLADALDKHPIARSLVQTGLPTLIFSLLSIAVPYLYDWLANKQGMISQGDVELSIISKNFFFTFFNLFIVFTVWSTASTFYDFWKELQDILKDTAGIAYAVAKSLEGLSPFYVNLIILQGFGLFPFRLLEFGSVVLYPVWLISAKTPRDHAELAKPPVFSYGFFLPQTMLIFVICIVYSVLPSSWLITLFGLVYFFIGGFIYKYQLLYAMDHAHHSTGRAWPMICNRIVMGLVVFQIAMTGVVALNGALTASIFMLPLLGATIWFTIYFQRTYHPLMKFIALRSIDRNGPPDLPTPPESSWDRDTDRGRAVDTDPVTGLRYMNPNLTSPLEAMWVKNSRHGSNGRLQQGV
jgi:calcium permeable stress-gated cation channel